MLYKSVIWKEPNNVNIPADVDRTTFINNHTTWLSDFETNYKSQATKITSPLTEDTEINYDEFKSKIDGTTITWSDVMYHETPYAYFLYVNA